MITNIACLVVAHYCPQWQGWMVSFYAGLLLLLCMSLALYVRHAGIVVAEIRYKWWFLFAAFGALGLTIQGMLFMAFLVYMCIMLDGIGAGIALAVCTAAAFYRFWLAPRNVCLSSQHLQG